MWFFLVYVIGYMFGVSINMLDVFVVVVECIYVYLLIYDDLLVMDDDDLCCGLLICYVKFGEVNVIFVGDVL